MGTDDDEFQATSRRLARKRPRWRSGALRISGYEQGRISDYQNRCAKDGCRTDCRGHDAVRSQTMIAKLIRWSIDNRFLVLLATVMVTAWGVWSVFKTPLDAIPDLSDVQVIIRTTFPGQAPRIVEDQIT